MRFTKIVLCLLITLLVFIPQSQARSSSAPIPEALYPIKTVIAQKNVETYYPSVAGSFLVYSRRQNAEYSVVRTSINNPTQIERVVSPVALRESVRGGVAVANGSMGYASNRMGPISGWMRQGKGEMHVLIGNGGVYNGSLHPLHLNSSASGLMWCFDSTVQKIRYSQLIEEFGDTHQKKELMGQQWRNYDSDNFRYKMGYDRTKTGKRNKFNPPQLYVFNRNNGELAMIDNAYDGSFSADGSLMAFVREEHGDYQLWLQNIKTGEVSQLPNTIYAELEPALSPDGSKIAFISNRDSDGDVRNTSIYIMDINTGHTMRVTNAKEASDGSPAWKNNHTLYFHSNRDPQKSQSGLIDTWHIWEVNIR
ncbi:MAG: hypothetical protein R8L53_09585 [Mariprofundales bacterium]